MEFQGRYFDGTSLEPQQVTILLEAERLVIVGADGRTVSAHLKSCIRLLYADRLGGRVDLGVDGVKDVRLMIEDPGVRAALVQYLPVVGEKIDGDDWKTATRISAFLMALLVVMGLLFWQLERLLPTLVPDNVAAKLGRNLAENFTESFGGRCETADGRAALDRLVVRLGGDHVGASGVTVTVVGSEIVNAFALPGGQLVIFDGLIQQASSPDEVAGVIAHEMGHEQHKHALRGLARSLGMQVVGALISGGNVAQFSEQMVMLAYSRSMEEEADEAALSLLREAEISSEPMAGFFDRLGGEEASSDGSFMTIAGFFSTHPASAQRADVIRREGPRNGRQAMTDADWQALRDMCSAPGKKPPD